MSRLCLNRALGLTAMWLACAVPALAITDPPGRYAQPSNALVMPYDATTRSTLLEVSNLSGLSKMPGGQLLAGVTTHWVFWGESGEKLAEASICVVLNDTAAVDPRSVSSLDAENDPVGTPVDLSGTRGFVVVTAYQTDVRCGAANLNGSVLVDNAIVGSVQISSASGPEMSMSAIGLPLDATGTFTDLPNFQIAPGASPSVNVGSLNLQMATADVLDSSTVVLVGLKENAGVLPGELGPLSKKIRAKVTFFDVYSIPTTMPAVKFRNVLFTSIIPGNGSLIPGTVELLSPGMLKFTNLIAGEKPVGCNSFVFAFEGARMSTWGQSLYGAYVVGDQQQCI